MVLNLGGGTRYYPATATADGLLKAADFAKLATLQVPVLRLNYAPASDLLNGTAITAATWTDVSANQSFTVGSATAQLLVILRLKVLVNAASVGGLGGRLVFNSAGTPVTITFGGGVVTPAGGWGSIHGGDLWLPAAYLPTGTNTVKVQLYSENTATAYCRLSAAPNVEMFQLQVIEMAA